MSTFGDYVSKLSIRKRIIIFVVLPVVITTFLLNYYLTLVRLNDADSTIELRGELISGYLAIAAEYGLVTGDKESLQHLVDFTARKPDIVNIIIYDRAKQIISQANNVQGVVNSNRFISFFLKDRKPVSITEPVRISGFNVFDEQEDFVDKKQSRGKNEKIIGWIEIEVSPRSLLIQQQNILINSLIVAFFCLVLGILLSLQTERLMTRPILQLARIVQSIRNGQYKIPSTENLFGELGLLEKGINQMAMSLGEQHEQLREKIADATRELTNTINELEMKNNQLEQSQLEVTKASQAKEEFLARMSHEIRTPMNAVIGYATLLKQTQLEHDQREYARIIDRAAHQLLTVIDDILIFTKLESGVVPIENIQFDLQESLEDVISMLSQSAHDKGLELVLLIYSDVPVLLKGDPIRINQILINLVNNAIKFTTQGSVVVHVEVSDETNELTEIQVTVDDSGPGIDENQKEHLFEKFSQADSTITRRFGGTGLGLPIAKKLAELMQGSIGVESTPGEGSKFWFRVKCEKIPPDILYTRYTGMRGKKILVYDQNQFSVRAIRNNLLKWDISVFTARTINKAVEMLSVAQNGDRAGYDYAIFGLTLDDCQEKNYSIIYNNIREVYDGPLLFLVGKEPHNLPKNLGGDSESAVHFQRKPIARMALYNGLCKQFALQEAVSKVEVAVESVSKQHPSCHILVVEDNVFNRDLVSTLLRAKGFFVHLAENAQQAIEIVQQVHLDLILMDIHLPDMSGLDAAKRIRQIKSKNTISTRDIPIIALTADVFLDKKSTLSEATVNDCIVKPISEAEFWQTLKKYLPNSSSNTDAVDKFLELSEQQKYCLNNAINKILDDISNLIFNDNYQTVSEQIHQLKGLAGYYQLHSLNDIVSCMEASASSSDYNDISRLVKQAKELTSILV